jgi:hypothetical protein
LALSTTTGAAHAQGYAVRDRGGRTTSTLALMLCSRGDSYSARDKSGRQIGTVHRLPSGDYAERDQLGRTTGTVMRRR